MYAKKKLQNGYSFIELLVVIVIMVLIFSLTTANYRDFQTRKTMDNAVTLVKSDLRLVQEYARSGRNPGGGCDVLQGYKLVFTAGTTYSITAECSNIDVEVAEREVEAVDISGPDVRFNVLGRGTELSAGTSADIDLAHQNSSETRVITIEASGNFE